MFCRFNCSWPFCLHLPHLPARSIHWKRLYAGTVPANKEYAAGTVTANKKYAAGTVPANKKYAAGTPEKFKF